MSAMMDLKTQVLKLEENKATQRFRSLFKERFVNGKMVLIGLKVTAPEPNSFSINKVKDQKIFLNKLIHGQSRQAYYEERLNCDLSQKIPLTLEYVADIQRFKIDLWETFRQGGAYSWPIDDQQGGLYKIIESFVHSLLPKNRTKSLFLKTRTPWNDWFYEVAWDYTYIIYNKKEEEIIMICATDTD